MSACTDCWAGIIVGSGDCLCRIEGGLITTDETSFRAFCTGDYTACSTWRTEKDAIRAGDHSAVVSLDRAYQDSASDMSRLVATAQKRRLEAFQAGEDAIASQRVS